MMEKDIEILIQYGEADINSRLHLFLQFPGLRGAFQEIDRKDLATQRASPSSIKQHHKRKCSWLLSLLSRIIEIKILKNPRWIGRAEICSILWHERILKISGDPINDKV